jgi:hypothetical protein
MADSQHFTYRTWPVKLTFKIRVKCSALTKYGKPRAEKRKIPEPSSPLTTLLSTPSGARNDQSNQLKQINAVTRLAGYAKRGDAVQQLHEQWRCMQEGCPNYRNYCYWNASKRPGLHFKLNQPDVDSWASAIERDETTRWAATDKCKHRIYAKGHVERGNLASNKQTPAQRMREQIKKQRQEMQEMQLQIQADMIAEKVELMREKIEL